MQLYQALITLDGWTFVAQICNLMIQLFIFKKFLLNPVKKVIAERKAKADSQIADATKLRTLTETPASNRPTARRTRRSGYAFSSASSPEKNWFPHTVCANQTGHTKTKTAR